jgi:DNA-binding transcriptional LysR family regulator
MNDAHVRPLHGIDLNLLVALDALLAASSVTQASAVLGVTQSAMSHTLGRLRRLFDDPLLVRSGAGMVLTPRAVGMAIPLRERLVGLGQLLTPPDAFTPSTAVRTYRLIAPDLFDALLLPALAAAVCGAGRGLNLVMLPTQSVRRDEALATGELDVALVPVGEGQGLDAPAQMMQRTLFRDRFVCFARREHPVLQGDWTAERFAAADHAMVTMSGRGQGVVDAVLAQRGLTRRVALRLPSFTAAPHVIRQTDMVLTAPASLAGLMPDDVVMREPPFALPSHSMVMVWHRRFDADPGHRWLRKRLVQVAGQVSSEKRRALMP